MALLITSGGFIVAASCVETTSALSCSHEYHLFGTNDHTAASFKLAILLLMFLLNVSNFSSSVADPVVSRLQSLQPPKVGTPTCYFGQFWLTSAWKLKNVYRNGSAHSCLIPPCPPRSANDPTPHFCAQCKLLCQRKKHT